LILGERVGAVNLLIIGNMSVGETYRTLGNYPKAREFLSRAVALIDADNEYDALGQVGLPSVRARSHLAWTLAEMGDFHGAQRTAAEASRVANASAHAYSVCHACLGLGGTRIRQGEFEAAIPILTRGITTSEQVPLLRPPIGVDLGVAHARCGRIAEGLAYIEPAVESAKTMGRLSRLALMLVKCGEVHLLAGEQQEASRLATTALDLATGQKERGNEAYALHLLGEIHAGDGVETTVAERYYRASLALAAELGMRPLVARCHAGLSQLYAQADKLQKAREHHAAAVSMYREMDMRFWLVQLEAESMV
jgi:tetratricopeptide (TPR) repeat protein